MLGILAQIPSLQSHDSLAWVTPLIQVATAGGFGALVWYLIVRHIPTIEERHQAERIESRQQFIQTIDKHEQSMSSLVSDYKDIAKAVTQELSAFRNMMEKVVHR